MTPTSEQAFHPTADVGALRIARVYAEALLNTATQGGQADVVLEELDSLVHDVFAADGAIEEFLASPVVPAKQKSDVIEATFRGRGSDLFVDFLMVLHHHGRLGLLRHIRYAYDQLHDQRIHRVRIHVRSAVPLADDQRHSLEQLARQSLRLDPVLVTSVDPDLLGGLIVRVGDWQYDGSVRTRVQTIRNQIIERSSHEIQSGRDRFGSE